MEMWKLGLRIGSKLDVKDTVDKWCEATVVAVDREAANVYVTYTFWTPKVCVFEKPYFSECNRWGGRQRDQLSAPGGIKNWTCCRLKEGSFG